MDQHTMKTKRSIAHWMPPLRIKPINYKAVLDTEALSKDVSSYLAKGNGIDCFDTFNVYTGTRETLESPVVMNKAKQRTYMAGQLRKDLMGTRYTTAEFNTTLDLLLEGES